MNSENNFVATKIVKLFESLFFMTTSTPEYFFFLWMLHLYFLLEIFSLYKRFRPQKISLKPLSLYPEKEKHESPYHVCCSFLGLPRCANQG